MSQDHNHLSHATWECKYRVVFTPKYRKRVYSRRSGATWALYPTSPPSCGIFWVTNSGASSCN